MNTAPWPLRSASLARNAASWRASLGKARLCRAQATAPATCRAGERPPACAPTCVAIPSRGHATCRRVPIAANAADLDLARQGGGAAEVLRDRGAQATAAGAARRAESGDRRCRRGRSRPRRCSAFTSRGSEKRPEPFRPKPRPVRQNVRFRQPRQWPHRQPGIGYRSSALLICYNVHASRRP